jgi:hypothetical protein
MDADEQIRQLITAQVVAYVALVNTLKERGDLDAKALRERLDHFSKRFGEQQQPLTAEVLRGMSAALAGGSAGEAAIRELLH